MILIIFHSTGDREGENERRKGGGVRGGLNGEMNIKQTEMEGGE